MVRRFIPEMEVKTSKRYEFLVEEVLNHLRKADAFCLLTIIVAGKSRSLSISTSTFPNDDEEIERMISL